MAEGHFAVSYCTIVMCTCMRTDKVLYYISLVNCPPCLHTSLNAADDITCRHGFKAKQERRVVTALLH